MKKTSEVKVPAKTIKATTRKVESVYCDIDNVRIPRGSVYGQCTLCNRDVCQQHTRRDPRDWGDYPARYCDICYRLKFEGKYNDIYDELQANLEREEAILERKIKKESLAWKPSN